MSASERTCMTCGTVYYGEVFTFFGKCNVCRQTEAIVGRRENELDRTGNLARENVYKLRNPAPVEYIYVPVPDNTRNNQRYVEDYQAPDPSVSTAYERARQTTQQKLPMTRNIKRVFLITIGLLLLYTVFHLNG